VYSKAEFCVVLLVITFQTTKTPVDMNATQKFAMLLLLLASQVIICL
jgi:hypothetical protein